MTGLASQPRCYRSEFRMAYHIVLPNALNLTKLVDEASRGERPRHFAAVLAGQLGAQVHEPGQEEEQPLDSLRKHVLPSASLWGLARRVSASAAPDDVIFIPAELPGLQIAAICGQRQKRPRIAIWVHSVDRPRARFVLKWWRMNEKVDLFLACSQAQVSFLRSYLKLSDDRVQFIWDNTDTEFFCPGPMSPGKKRPLVVSVGLEQRDYRTLAEATHDMDVDVAISGFSKDALVYQRTFPDTMPRNMTRQFYPWRDLAQLYRDADVVVVSCHENKYAAGVQSLMEAMASGRPVIATATQGLKEYCTYPVVAIKPGNAPAMRHAIDTVLKNESDSRERGLRGRDIAAARFSTDQLVGRLAEYLRGLH